MRCSWEKKEAIMPQLYDFDMDVPYLKMNEIKGGETITFCDEGRLVDDRWGSNKLQIDIRMPNGELRRITVNKTSQRNLMGAYGASTKDWIGKTAMLTKQNMLVGGNMKQALIIQSS